MRVIFIFKYLWTKYYELKSDTDVKYKIANKPKIPEKEML